MSRAAGTWSPIHGSAWTHPETRQAVADLLTNDRRTRAEAAPYLVLGWIHRLRLWALGNNEAGIVGGLSDVVLATVAWPEGIEARGNARAVGALVRSALRAGGFLEGEGEAESIRDFRSDHRRLLRDRQRKREKEEAEARSLESSAERSAELAREPSGATGTGTGTGNGIGSGSGTGTARSVVPIEAFPVEDHPIVQAIRSVPLPAWRDDPNVTPPWLAALRAAASGRDLVADVRRAASWWTSNADKVRGRRSCTGTIRTFTKDDGRGGAPGRADAGPPPPRDDDDVLERMRAEVANGQPRGMA